ncbi:hypothetical protein CANCADRAFT_3722 [Tortispora caseinolytica NRRL Y-17796]|uniref:t-SNARE coiled-coil homology domain-containing protein n=1 Tax=Tortispora caseinolytica NRRL Y-17796 TaxID=767744 RepID=A0A1E4TBJ6_9ASCO|nr:hypothetical protein CANCADRAFT_3722 [Tortispora caseinolytica NRRL Y-17796]
MAFDLEGGYSDSPEFAEITANVSDALLELSGQSATLARMGAQIGTAKDTPQLQDKISKLLDKAQDGARKLSIESKKLQAWDEPTSAQRFTQQKLEREATSLIAELQAVQNDIAKRQRQALAQQRQALESSQAAVSGQSGGEQIMLQEQIANEQEVEYQRALIEEREEEIREIEQGVSEINEIYRDLGTIVAEQGTIVDNIEANISNVAVHTQGASRELAKASRKQRESRYRRCCLLVILSVILLIVLLAILPALT